MSEEFEKNEDEKKGFFYKMKMSEHKGFEISMFAISIVLSLAVVTSAVWAGVYMHNASGNDISDAEANAGSVTESAVVADEDDKDPVPTPRGNAVISDTDDDGDEIDPDLKDAKFGYTTAVVNLRSSASLTASVLAKVPMGVRVKLIRMTDDNWMEVNYQGQTGFIHARYLSTKKIEPLATIKPTKEPEATATAKPTPKPTKKPRKTKRPQRTERPDPPEPDYTEEPEEPTPEPTKEPTPEPTKEPTPKPTKEPTPPPVNTKTPDQGSEAE